MKIRMQAAVAASTLACVSTAFAGLDGFYGDQAAFEDAALTSGKFLKGFIDFENYVGPDIIGAFGTLNEFGDFEVGGGTDDILGPAGELLFPGGFGSDNILFRTSGDGGFVAVTQAAGFPGVDSAAFGANTFVANLEMVFADELKTAVGFDFLDVEGFSGPAQIEITDGLGNVDIIAIQAGSFAGYVDSDGIASINITGPELKIVDNIQLWNIPGPGALALFGLGGLVGRRRRG